MSHGFQKWLVERDAQQLLQRPIEEIEFLFQPFFIPQPYSVDFSDPFDADPRPFRVPYTRKPPYDEKDGLYIQFASNASYTLTHGDMIRCTEVGIKMWGLGNDEAVQLLFNIEEIFEPVFRIRDGTEEEEECQIFGMGHVDYWPELRRALNYHEWNTEQVEDWRRFHQRYLREGRRSIWEVHRE